MSIGLFDLDMEKYCPVPFNLELMKLSSYYKKKREIVSLSPAFCPAMYTQFIVRKDYYDGSFPKELLSEDNNRFSINFLFDFNVIYSEYPCVNS